MKENEERAGEGREIPQIVIQVWPQVKERNRRLNESVQPAIQSKASLGKAIDKFSSRSWLSEETHFLPK